MSLFAIASLRAPLAPLPRATEPPSLIARGESGIATLLLPSPLPGVAEEPWTRFVRVLQTQSLNHVSASNALGMFELTPRRLSDLGLLVGLVPRRSPSGRMVRVGTFVSPLTARRFLSDPVLQYNTFARSMTDYAAQIRAGEIGIPAGVSLSGALAILHRAGMGGLRTWGDSARRLPETMALQRAAEGIF